MKEKKREKTAEGCCTRIADWKMENLQATNRWAGGMPMAGTQSVCQNSFRLQCLLQECSECQLLLKA